MKAPGQHRPSKPYRGGVIQVHLTRLCDKACFNCTQASQLAGETPFMTPEQFDQACASLKGYWGVIGVFGGNPCTSPHFEACCEVMRKHFPKEQCGLWSNNPINPNKARAARATFNPAYSNLNCHLDQKAFRLWKEHWPESMPFGLDKDSRHSPPFVAMKDVLKRPCPNCGGKFWKDPPANETQTEKVACLTCKDGYVYDEAKAWELISGCDINQHWSAMIGVFRGQLRAWFCEVAGAQSMLHQHEPDYPDTGLDPMLKYYRKKGTEPWLLLIGDEPEFPANNVEFGRWWQLPMVEFDNQVRKHCHECSVPLKGYGELAQAQKGCEQTSKTHAGVYFPKRRDRPVQVVERLAQLETGKLRSGRVTGYMQNA
jgi:hypothetical protein